MLMKEKDVDIALRRLDVELTPEELSELMAVLDVNEVKFLSLFPFSYLPMSLSIHKRFIHHHLSPIPSHLMLST